MPVPGTATAVWWEPLIDQSLYFGIPQVGIVDKNGKYLENQQLEVDVEVAQDPELMISGRDQQIEKAVEVLLQDLDKK
jgi:C-terminal processing protease CtpA/Prc